MSDASVRRVLERPAFPVQPTRRELEVLRLVADGRSNAQIAVRLLISERTAKHHVSSLLRKFQARDRAHLVALGFRSGILRVNCP